MNITDFKIIKLDTVDSTNNYLKTIVKKGECSPTIVISDCQTAGKGTRNRTFISKKGGLYLSILLPPCDTRFITPMTAVAVSDSVEQMSGRTTEIKWVNDIYLNGKKLSGILCEAVFSENVEKPYVIVGIGVNLFLPKDNFSTEIKDIAISLYDTENDDIKEKFFNTLITNFLQYYDTLGNKTFLEKYRNKNFVLGKTVTVVFENKKTDAVAVSIDDECRLVVRFDDGSQKALNSGDVLLKK